MAPPNETRISCEGAARKPPRTSHQYLKRGALQVGARPRLLHALVRRLYWASVVALEPKPP